MFYKFKEVPAGGKKSSQLTNYTKRDKLTLKK